MRSLNSAELLQIWEEGLDKSVLHSALLLLSKSCNLPIETVGALSIGERDAQLLKLREWLFGNKLLNTAHCPNCAECVEWTMTTFDLQLQLPSFLEGKPKVLEVLSEGYHIRFRLPNSIDILDMTREKNSAYNSQQLLLHCILELVDCPKDISSANLPHHILDSIQHKMEIEDPQANISIALTCPSCNQQWASVFDILSYLWIEIDNWAKHILQEVYILAKAFNWSEHDILNMSIRRRQLYLEMLRI